MGSFMPWPPYPWEKKTRHSLNESQSGSRRGGGGRNLWICRESNDGLQTWSLFTLLTHPSGLTTGQDIRIIKDAQHKPTFGLSYWSFVKIGRTVCVLLCADWLAHVKEISHISYCGRRQALYPLVLNFNKSTISYLNLLKATGYVIHQQFNI